MSLLEWWNAPALKKEFHSGRSNPITYSDRSQPFMGITTFKTLLNRGQGEAIFDPIPRWAQEFGARRINPLEFSAWSEDKATMHLELINSGIHTPHTILLSPFLEEPVDKPIDLSPLGDNFVIKPSNGGGGEGVILGASSIEEILQARMEFPEQKYFTSGACHTAHHQRHAGVVPHLLCQWRNLSMLVGYNYAHLRPCYSGGRVAVSPGQAERHHEAHRIHLQTRLVQH